MHDKISDTLFLSNKWVIYGLDLELESIRATYVATVSTQVEGVIPGQKTVLKHELKHFHSLI